MKYLHRVIAIINIWRWEFIPGFANKDKENKKKKDLRKGQLRKGIYRPCYLDISLRIECFKGLAA